MGRLFNRGEWRLAVAGTLAGSLTAFLVLFLWVRGVGGGSAALTRGPAGGSARALGEHVAARLAARPLARRPLTGTLSLRARNVVWRDPGTGRLFASAPAATATIDAAAANRLDILLANVVLDRPRLELTTDGRHWNYERPLAGVLADEPPDGRRHATFRIASLRLLQGTVAVDMPERDFTLTGVEARLANVELAAPGLEAPRLELFSASADLRMSGQDRSWALSGERGRLSFPSATTHFMLAAVTVAGTRLEDVQGVWDPAQPGYGVTAAGRAPGVRLAELQFLSPERLPREGTASFGFEVAPLAGDGTALRIQNLQLVSGGSRLTGSVSAEAFPGRLAIERVALDAENVALALLEPFTGPLPYRGTVSGTIAGPGADIRLALAARLSAEAVPERFGVRLGGSVGLTRSGLELRDLKAELEQVPLRALRAVAPGLPLAGLATGTVELSGKPGQAPLQLALRLELGTGITTVTGSLDLTGPVPGYDVTGRLIGINLQSVLAPAVPPVSLTARFAAAGTGFEPATAIARVRIDGSFTGWRSVPGDTVAVAAAVAGGLVQVSSFRARLASAAAELDGNWRFAEPLSGAVRYRLAVADLAPFGPYLPVVRDSAATGAVQAEGTISGPLAALRLAGSVTGSGIRAGGWGAGTLTGTYDLTLADSLPAVAARLEGKDLRTPYAGGYQSVVANVRLVSPELRLELTGTLVAGGEVAVVAEGSVPRGGPRSVLLRRAHFDLPEGRWELQSPATITWGGADGVRVAGLQLRNAQTAGQLSLDGRILPLARLDVRAVAAGLPLDQLADLLGREQLVSGRLWADLTVSTPAAGPQIRGTFRLDDTRVQGVALSRLDGTLDYAAGSARTRFTAVFDSAGGRLELDGTIPLRVSLQDSVDVGLADGGVLAATIIAERVSLRPFGLLAPRVRSLDGQVDGTLTLSGTVAEPRLEGQLSLGGGRVTVPELNQRFDSIGGVVSFQGRTASIRDLRVKRGGWARVNGTVTFEELDRPVLAVAADLSRFQPIGADDHPDAAFTGRIALGGELDALVLSGRVTIADGYLAVPQLGAGFNPAYLDEIDPTPVLGRDFGESQEAGWLSHARIQGLRATFGEGAWVEAFDATLQLRGDLDIEKSGDELRLTGTLEGERGTYTLAAGPIIRRFEITRSQVRFLGAPEPNPAIDITARRIVLDPDGRRMEVEVRITGTARTPRLALASADAPNIPESELLSFLLFGRRSLALGETFATTGELVVEQTLFGGVAEVAGLELERALSANLGLQLDLFQVRFGRGFGGLTTPTFVLGRQISNDFFLTVESGLNALFGDAGGAANTWAVRLEWAIDPRQTLELGSEPLNRARLLRGIGAALPPGRPSPQQLYGEYRRRWVY